MARMPCSTGSAGAYYCGWAITGRTTVPHLVASAEFPLAGSRHRSWCGQMITVIALTLDARDCQGAAPSATSSSA
ncbi:MAG: hypothetical protein ACRDRU_19490 [Pseudonocardiaceae bacterium]